MSNDKRPLTKKDLAKLRDLAGRFEEAVSAVLYGEDYKQVCMAAGVDHTIPATEAIATMAAARDQAQEKFAALVDVDLSVKDLEMKIRDGTFNMRVIWDDESKPITRMVGAMLMHVLLGEGDQEPVLPPNYQAIEMRLSPAGEAEIRCHSEIVRPGGKSAHELRLDAEAALRKYGQHEYDCDEVMAAGEPCKCGFQAALDKLAPAT